MCVRCSHQSDCELVPYWHCYVIHLLQASSGLLHLTVYLPCHRARSAMMLPRGQARCIGIPSPHFWH